MGRGPSPARVRARFSLAARGLRRPADAAAVTPPPAPTPAPVPVPPPPPANALAAGVALVPPAATIYDEWAERALTAFRTSCPALVQPAGPVGPRARPGLGAALRRGGEPSLRSKRRRSSTTVSTGCGSATERPSRPAITSRKSRARACQQPGYAPIYRFRRDLVRCTRPDGTDGRGRLDETGDLRALISARAEIEDGALANKGLEIAWAADPVDLFFVEIQGSGRVAFPDGTSMRIGYADQNGLPYTAIGKLLRDRGILPPGGASMQSIKDWIRANPDQGRAADARECVLHLLQGADRARAGRCARTSR